MGEKDKKKKRPPRLQRANPIHALLLVIIGGYLMYMAYQMLENTRSGNSSMSMTTTVVLMAVMILAGLGVWAYAGYIYYVIKTTEAQSGEDGASEEAPASPEPEETDCLPEERALEEAPSDGDDQ